MEYYALVDWRQDKRKRNSKRLTRDDGQDLIKHLQERGVDVGKLRQ